ncbi:MAG: hypothetical protein GY782_08305 [Gammaproteobacteria bacterium]|nr:hypothetical protein [Gammaproteobacteria bacterium]
MHENEEYADTPRGKKELKKLNSAKETSQSFEKKYKEANDSINENNKIERRQKNKTNKHKLKIKTILKKNGFSELKVKGYDLALMLPDKKKPNNNFLYLEFLNDDLQYKCIDPNGEYQENTITWEELLKNGAAHELKPENQKSLQEFKTIKTAILRVTSERGHTQGKYEFYLNLIEESVNYNRLKAVASIYAWKADYHAKASII